MISARPSYPLQFSKYTIRQHGGRVISLVSYQKGPIRHAYEWQIGPFWQDTLDIYVYITVHACARISKIKSDQYSCVNDVWKAFKYCTCLQCYPKSKLKPKLCQTFLVLDNLICDWTNSFYFFTLTVCIARSSHDVLFGYTYHDTLFL